ncbi:MAG: carboxymuconolactone decarboxylase family protein [Bacteriovoracia bacterium]
MNLKKIDPALELMSEFSKHTKGTVAHIQKMRQEAIFSDGTVSAKYKTLSAMLLAISSRCEPCIRYYVSQAIERGTNEAELGEFLAVASTMGGCVGEMWALKAYKAFKDFSAGTTGSETSGETDPSCCHV